VLWAGLDDPDRAMAAAASALDDALGREFAPEKRAFTPHLTLARFDPAVALEGIEEEPIRSEPFRVERLVLFRSHLRRPAPVYEAMATFGLGGPAAPA
jgi:2'-5' RNA ligase